MHDPKSTKPGLRPGIASPATPGARASSTTGAPKDAGKPAGPTGKVRHDERGNAVWDWLAQTSRDAVDATSRLLKKLETPELKIEDTQDKELRIAPDPTTTKGSGYDPYNQATKPSKSGRK